MMFKWCAAVVIRPLQSLSTSLSSSTGLPAVPRKDGGGRITTANHPGKAPTHHIKAAIAFEREPKVWQPSLVRLDVEISQGVVLCAVEEVGTGTGEHVIHGVLGESKTAVIAGRVAEQKVIVAVKARY